MVTRRRLATLGVCLILLALVTALTGCGSGRTTAVTAPVPTTPVATTTTPAPETTTIPTPAPDPTKPPDFVVSGQTTEGDKVQVEGRFGPALPPAQSDANQTALSECGEATGRELVARLDLTTTIQSSLAGSVTVENFRPDGLGNGIVLFLVGSSEGASCHPGNLPASEVDLGTLQPHAANTTTLWVILVNAVTPKESHPSALALGKGWRMTLPTISVNNTPASQDVSIRGPRVIQCHQSESGEGYSFISVAGKVPSVIRGLQSFEHYSCKPGV